MGTGNKFATVEQESLIVGIIGGVLSILCFLAAVRVIGVQCSHHPDKTSRRRSSIHVLLCWFCLCAAISYFERVSSKDRPTGLGIGCHILSLWGLECAFLLFWNFWIHEVSLSLSLKSWATTLIMTVNSFYSLIAFGYACYVWFASRLGVDLQNSQFVDWVVFVFFGGPLLALWAVLFLVWGMYIYRRLQAHHLPLPRSESKIEQLSQRREKVCKIIALVVALEVCMLIRVLINVLDKISIAGGWKMDEMIVILLGDTIPSSLRSMLILYFTAFSAKTKNDTVVNISTTGGGNNNDEDPLNRDFINPFFPQLRTPLI